MRGWFGAVGFGVWRGGGGMRDLDQLDSGVWGGGWMRDLDQLDWGFWGGMDAGFGAVGFGGS